MCSISGAARKRFCMKGCRLLPPGHHNQGSLILLHTLEYSYTARKKKRDQGRQGLELLMCGRGRYCCDRVLAATASQAAPVCRQHSAEWCNTCLGTVTPFVLLVLRVIVGVPKLGALASRDRLDGSKTRSGVGNPVSPPPSRPLPHYRRGRAGQQAHCRCPQSTPSAPDFQMLDGLPERGAR